MSLVPLPHLPDDARAWVFGADRRLSPDEAERVRAVLPGFLEEWTAHRAALRAGFDLLESRFLVIAVDETDAPASGCSIDAMVGHLRDLERELGVSILDAAPVWYREADGIACVSRAEFRARSADGRVTADTTVLDPTVTRLSDVRSGAWERPARDSWHARLLPEAAAGGIRADG